MELFLQSSKCFDEKMKFYYKYYLMSAFFSLVK